MADVTKKPRVRAGLLFLPLLFIPGAVFASAGESVSGYPQGMLRLFIALGLVIGLLFLLVALSRKGMRFFPAARGGIIKVVEMRSLGPRKSLCLIEVKGEEILLGVSSDRIEMISSWPASNAPDSSYEKAVLSQDEGRT